MVTASQLFMFGSSIALAEVALLSGLSTGEAHAHYHILHLTDKHPAHKHSFVILL